MLEVLLVVLAALDVFEPHFLFLVPFLDAASSSASAFAALSAAQTNNQIRSFPLCEELLMQRFKFHIQVV